MTVNLDRLSRVISGSLPFAVIGGLLYAGIFIKPAAINASVAVPVLAPRDVFYDVAVPQDDVIWAVGQGGKIVRSGNSGKTWEIQASGTEANLQSIIAWDDAHAVVAGNTAVIRHTVDGGRSWQGVVDVPEAARGNKLIRVRRAGDDTAYLVGERGLVLKTSDRGQSWQSIGAKEDFTWNDIAVHGQTLVLAGEFGHVRRSTDGGRHWADIPTSGNSSLLGAHFSNDGSIAVAVGLEGAILRSLDAGKTWAPVSSGTDEHLFDVTTTPAGWMAVGDQGLYLRAPTEALEWTVHHLPENNYAWHTSAEPKNARVYLAGATLSVIDQNDNLELFK